MGAIKVNGHDSDAGCYIDGHWGQYGASRVLRLADDILGTDYFGQAERAARVDAQTLAADAHASMRDAYKLDDFDLARKLQHSAAHYYEEARNPIGMMTDELSGCEAVSWVADEAEAALNDVTTGGYWGWYEGEFFLIDNDSVDEDGNWIEED